jgi:hypothetical protein
MSGRKLDQPNFSWAPKTFMLPVGIALSTTRYNAFCTSEGLMSEYSCIYFNNATLQRTQRWYLQDVAKGRFYSVLDVEHGDVFAEPPDAYTCNGLLLDSLPQIERMENAAAVSIKTDNQQHVDGEEFRPICNYQRRLLVACVAEEEVKKNHDSCVVINMSGSGRLKVYVV